MLTLVLLGAVLSGFSLPGAPMLNESHASVTNQGIEKPKRPISIANLKSKDIQKILGRRLSLGEKFVFIVLKHKLNHQSRTASERGKTALIFSVSGAVLLIIGLFVPPLLVGAFIAALIGIILGSIAKKKDSSDGKAIAALLTGWITIALLALLLLLAAIVVASWSWAW